MKERSMNIGMVSSVASLASAGDRQVFGAQVVSRTLDYMNGSSGSLSRVNADYDFQTKVLDAAMTGKGRIVDMMA
jgi:hypothetical protein